MMVIWLGISWWALQAQPQQPGGTWRLILGLLPFVFFFVLLYVLFILPTQRQQKKHRQMIARLKVGDKVVTNSGIYGTIVKVGDRTFKLRVADRVIITIDKTAIAGPQPTESESDV